MADSTLNAFVASGTTAERLAFTPTPPTPASGPDFGYLWFDTDDGLTYAWDGSSWQAPAGSGTVTNTGTLTSGKTIVGNGSADVTVSSLTATVVGSASGTLAAATAGTDYVAPGGALGTPSSGTLTSCTGLPLATGVTGTLASSHLSTAAQTRAITFAIDGGGSALTTGVKASLYVPYACTITAVTMLADQSGSCVVDIWKDTLANYPPTVADSITASAKPTLSSQTNSQDTTLTGWTTSIGAGDTLRFNIDSASTLTRLNLTLTVTVS